MTGQNLKMDLSVKGRKRFCILVCNFDFLSLSFDVSQDLITV